MNYSLLRSDARERLKGNWGTAVLTVLVYMVLSIAMEGLGFVAGDLLSLIGSIVFIIAYGPLQYGLNSVFLKINRKQKTEMSDLFTGFSSDIGNKINAGVSIYLFTFLWSLLLIIPGIVASYSYSMTYFIMLDNPKMRSSDAIKKSKEMMKGHKMELFCLDLTFIGWILLSVLTLGIGMLWVSAYMTTARARFYEAISGSTGVTEEVETEVKNADEVAPYTEDPDATQIYRLKCNDCGATETHTQKTSTCPYCGSTMTEQ